MSAPADHRGRCGTCWFFTVASVPNDDATPVLGECHRYPPRHRSPHSGDPAFFPFVNEDDWCGEWKSPS